MIWRRRQLAGTTSLADLHCIIQIAMGWDDDYLHHFHIHGVDCGISKPRDNAFRHDVEQVFLDDFEFGASDRFTYTYNYVDWWLCEVRIEVITTQDEAVQRCFGGSGREDAHRYYKVDEVRSGADVLLREAPGRRAYCSRRVPQLVRRLLRREIQPPRHQLTAQGIVPSGAHLKHTAWS